MSIPVMISVEGRRCLVVGGGPVGVRKARQLHTAGADVSILSRSLSEEIEGVPFEQGLYSTERLHEIGPWLVVAATSSREVNQQIGQDARAAGILTMIADNPAEADLKGIMQRERDDVTYMITTGSPLLSRMMLERALDLVTPAVATFGEWLRVLRPPSREIIAEQPKRAALWREVMASDVLDLLEQGKEEAARKRLEEIVGPELAAYLPA